MTETRPILSVRGLSVVFGSGAEAVDAVRQLGVDLRGAFLAKQQVDDPELYVFPMQGDTYAWFRAGAFSLYTSVGPHANVRESSLGKHPFGSREYWLMWRPKTTGYYARAGRFMMPFGLRSPDHRMYVRRDLIERL